ncbi:putative peptidase [Mycobacteroides abscessus subsp. abscessus]|nr:putative peptidase [Mycobacteroides abscessus subsp. abscessus]
MGTIATTAAKNRADLAALEQLRAAAAERGRWLNHLPYQDLPPMQPGDPRVAPWYFDWIRHSTGHGAISAWSSARGIIWPGGANHQARHRC